MSEWAILDRLGTKGSEPDLMPAHREPASLDIGTNVRALGPNLANAGGFTLVSAMPTQANTLYLAKTFNQRLVVLAAQASVYQFDGAIWTDITGPAVDDGQDMRWSGGWLAGALTLANQEKVRTFKPGVDLATVPMQYDPVTGDTWESLGNSARSFRPFREHMLAANVNLGGVEYPSRVQWSHPVEPGQVPEDWVPTDTNFAGDVDLADTAGSVVDMAPLRDDLIVYKRDAIYLCQWVQGNQVFSFRRITSNKGIHARDCVTEHGGIHWCQGIEDIFRVDGNTAQSIVWGRIKRSWLADRNADLAEYGFVSVDPVNEEMLFAYVSKNAPVGYLYPDRALVFSLRNQSWFFRDYGVEMPFAKVTLSVVNQESADLVYYGIDRTNQRLLDLESAPDRLGSPTPASFERTGLFADPGHDWVQVDRAKLLITGQPASLQLGAQAAQDAATLWEAAQTVDPATDYKTDIRTNGNLIAYRVSLDTLSNWQVGAVNLLVQKSGERG